MMSENGRSAEAAEPPAFTGGPDPEFEVIGVRALKRSAAPALAFTVRVADGSPRSIFTIALTSLITVEPAKRSYDEASRERLVELFGAPERWSATAQSFRWGQIDSLVPAFETETEFELRLDCSYDLELAATKYFAGVGDGEAPLRFHFNGTVFYPGEDGRMQMVQLPWDRSARFGMPVATWREMIAAHYPHRSWIPADRETVARLERLKVERGLPTFDAALAALLDGLEDQG